MRKISLHKIVETELDYNVGPITRAELRSVITKMKRRKSPGPDEVPLELFKEMDDINLDRTLALLNEWWDGEDLPQEIAYARVTSTHFKKRRFARFR